MERLRALVESYRGLADVFHDILAEQSLDALLERTADTLERLVPYDALTIFQADETHRLLLPVLARDGWEANIMGSPIPFGAGITGWAVEERSPVLLAKAHLDPRVQVVPGTPADEPETLISVPLIARDAVKGALNIYRLGEEASFSEDEFELAQRFGDAAALALDNAQIRQRLEHQAQTDSLTGLFNHRAFQEQLRLELARAGRSRDPVALLMLDVDDFKRANDVYGHGAGDQILMALAEVLRSTARATDVVCRLGGDEFAVIMRSSEGEPALALGRRVAERVASIEPDATGGFGTLTVSIGIAEGPKHAMNPRELVACAEAAMMAAKAQGKDGVVLFDDGVSERPDGADTARHEVRSLAHMKLLQSLGSKLNRLNDVRRIGEVVANELRTLIDYHSCRVYVVEGTELTPIAVRGDFGLAEDGGRLPESALKLRLGEGIIGRAAETGRSLLVPNTLLCDFGVLLPGTPAVEESLIATPLTYGTRTVGVVVISKLGVAGFDGDDVRLLEVLAGHASVALENARLYSAQRREAENARALLELGRELAAADGLEDVLRRVVEQTAKILLAPRSAVWLQAAKTGPLVRRALSGYDGNERELRREARCDRDLTRALLEGEAPFLDTGAGGLADCLAGEGDVRLAVAPLTVEDRLGCIVAAVGEGGPEFSERDLELLDGIAQGARLAMASVRNVESLESTFLSTVEALANALEANDEYTSSHTRWITDAALSVGTELALDAKALKRLELGALFHDIGKIGVPTSILGKPGPLTPEEQRLIEMHPQLGERILSPIERLAEVRPIVESAHEHFDGGGYPRGKAGEEIPLESRIILVCDAFHAMTTDRPYRRQLPVEEACRRLEEEAGGEFDPRIVEVFLRVLPRLPAPEDAAGSGTNGVAPARAREQTLRAL